MFEEIKNEYRQFMIDHNIIDLIQYVPNNEYKLQYRIYHHNLDLDLIDFNFPYSGKEYILIKLYSYGFYLPKFWILQWHFFSSILKYPSQHLYKIQDDHYIYDLSSTIDLFYPDKNSVLFISLDLFPNIFMDLFMLKDNIWENNLLQFIIPIVEYLGPPENFILKLKNRLYNKF
jgi:hypothetical protein